MTCLHNLVVLVALLVCSLTFCSAQNYCPAFLRGNDTACSCYSYVDGAVIKCVGRQGPAVVEQLKTVQTEIRELVIEQANIIEIGPRAFRNLRVKKLVLDNNKIHTINADAFRGLEQSLQSLSIAHNRLTYIPTDALMDMSMLQVLNLECNKIGNLEAPVLKNVSSLIELNLACNQICSIADSAFIDIKRTLQSAILDNNCMEQFPATAFREFQALLGLHIQYNQIVSLSALQSVELPNLIMLKLGGNRLSGIDRGLSASVPALRYLYVDSNQMNSIVPDTLQQFAQLEILDFSNNNIAELSSGSLKGLERLMQINLEGNSIKDIAPGAFANTPLLLLMLGDNCLTSVNPQMFQGVPFLRQLSLSNNNIRLIQPLSFSHLANLHLLDLTYNKIQVIQPGALAASGHVTVLLQETPLVCAQDGYHIVQGGRPIHLLNEPNKVCQTDYTRDVTDQCPTRKLAPTPPTCCTEVSSLTTPVPVTIDPSAIYRPKQRTTTQRSFTPQQFDPLTIPTIRTLGTGPTTAAPSVTSRSPSINMERFWRLTRRPQQDIRSRDLNKLTTNFNLETTTRQPIVKTTRPATVVSNATPPRAQAFIPAATPGNNIVDPLLAGPFIPNSGLIAGNFGSDTPQLPPWILTADRFKSQKPAVAGSSQDNQGVVVDFSQDGGSLRVVGQPKLISDTVKS